MRWFKPWLGGFAALLGVVGAIACVVGLVVVWNIRGRVDDTIESISRRAEAVLTRLAERSKQATGYIDNVRESARELNERVQRASAEVIGEPDNTGLTLDDIERQLTARVQLVASCMELIRSMAELVEELLQAVESTSAFASRDSHKLADMIEAAQARRGELQQLSESVEDIRSAVKEIRARSNVAQNAERITTLCSRINALLAKIERRAVSFQDATLETRTDVSNFATRIRGQTLLAAVIVSALIVWIMIAQISLAVHGGGWLGLRSKRKREIPGG